MFNPVSLAAGGRGVYNLIGPVVSQTSRAIKDVAKQILDIETATVVSDELSASETVVVFDSDPAGEQVVARSITGTYERDTRVYCLKYPPNGVLILGRNDGRLRLNTTGDVSLTSTRHAFQIGPTTGTNIRMDNNEIMAVTNGGAGNLNLQTNGGRLELFDQVDGILDLNGNSGMIASVMRYKYDFETTNITGITDAVTGAAPGILGTPINGMTFVAPPSGIVSFSVGGYFEMDGDAGANDDVLHFIGQIRTGSTIGSGTLFYDGDGDDGPHVAIGVGPTVGTIIRGMFGSIPAIVTGLTPGDTYNASTRYYTVGVTGTGASIFARQVGVQPQP